MIAIIMENEMVELSTNDWILCVNLIENIVYVAILY